MSEERVFDTIEFPVKYDPYGICILDSKNNKVLDVRGWGRIQYLDHPEDRQDEIGKWLELIMNDSWGG